MDMFDTIIRSGMVVLEDRVERADIGIRDGKIAVIGDCLKGEARTEIDAAGKHVFPGAIDTHSHVFDPGPFNFQEDWMCASSAAASGGFTCLIDMPNIEPEIVDEQVLEYKKQTAGQHSVVDFSFWGAGIVRAAQNIPALRKAGCAAFKAFTSEGSPTYASLSHQEQVDMMQTVKKAGGIMAFHAEDLSIVSTLTKRARDAGEAWNLKIHDAVRPYYAELAAIQNILLFARHTGCPVHICHLSIPEGAEMIRRAKAEGVDVTVESCAHYFLLNHEDAYDAGPFAKIMPPLRSRERSEKMWEYLADGTIDYMGTDHAPYTVEQKSPSDGDYWKVPGGAPSIGIAFPMMVDEAVNKRGIPAWRMARFTSGNAARRFGFYPQKGVIMVGADADLALADLNAEWVYAGLKSLSKIKSDRYAYEGRKIGCRIVSTLVRGELVWDGCRIVAEPGYGRFMPSAMK